MLTGSYHNHNQVQLWSLDDHSRVYNETLGAGGISCMVYAARFSKFDDGRFFAVGGTGSHEVHFYRRDNFEKFAVVTNLPRAVYGIDWANLNSKVAMGCGDGSVRVYRVNNAS